MESDDGLAFDGRDPLRVTPEEINAAKRAWLTARDSDEESARDRAELLFDYYRFLISVEARQISDDLHSEGGANDP